MNRVDHFKPESSSSSSSAAPATKTSAAANTAAASATATPSPQPTSDDKPNTVAIAVGVVVGVVGLAAICFGVWYFLRKRRQRQAEEDYRRNAANVNAFVNGGKMHTSNSSMNDSRLDPSFMDRRQSNGSIADNEDYSRRILKVCWTKSVSRRSNNTNAAIGYQCISKSMMAPRHRSTAIFCHLVIFLR